jgi:hypothetical protein
MIGHKKGIQICLASGFLGYAPTILSLYTKREVVMPPAEPRPNVRPPCRFTS